MAATKQLKRLSIAIAGGVVLLPAAPVTFVLLSWLVPT